MKRQFLLLPLIAVLAACNKGSGNNDIFTQVRKQKVSSETKQGVMDRYDGFEIIFAITTNSQSYQKQDGEWVPNTPFSYTSYYKTVGSFHKEMPDIALYDIIYYDTENEYESLSFRVSTVGGKYQIETDLNDWYDGKPKEIYNRVYDSLFSWNTSFFCGNSYFLASTARKTFMPQQALNKFAKKFSLTEDEHGAAGTFEIVSDGSEMVYAPSNYIQYEITYCSVRYDSYFLAGYECDFGITYTVDDNKATMFYSTEIVSINYLQR